MGDDTMPYRHRQFRLILEDLTHSGHAERVKQIVQERLRAVVCVDNPCRRSARAGVYPAPQHSTGPPADYAPAYACQIGKKHIMDVPRRGSRKG